MIKRRSQIETRVLEDMAGYICACARTAPKTRGIDNLEIIALTGDTVKRLRPKMTAIAKRDNRPSCERDANSLKYITAAVVIGTTTGPLGLNCGFCNYSDCRALKKSGGVCVYNSMDLGIALGSAASLAGRLHIDSRLMYSIGKAAMELRLFKKNVKMAIGIPLSISGKNPFFDRK